MTILILVGMGATILVAAALFVWWWRSQLDAENANTLPPLIYPLEPTPPQPPTHTHEHEHAKNNGSANSNGNGNGAGRPHANGNGVSHTHVNGNGTPLPADAPIARPVVFEPPHITNRTQVRPRHVDHDDGETVRFVRPTETSVQLLPGRLEVVEGKTPYKEIRFVRIPGEPAHMILGRESGVTPHYVGLESPTVSRRHARFDFADNRWVVKNLSRTNPLVVNDNELSDTDIGRPLADGDRLELGEVVLRFHAH